MIIAKVIGVWISNMDVKDLLRIRTVEIEENESNQLFYHDWIILSLVNSLFFSFSIIPITNKGTK